MPPHSALLFPAPVSFLQCFRGWPGRAWARASRLSLANRDNISCLESLGRRLPWLAIAGPAASRPSPMPATEANPHVGGVSLILVKCEMSNAPERPKTTPVFRPGDCTVYPADTIRLSAEKQFWTITFGFATAAYPAGAPERMCLRRAILQELTQRIRYVGFTPFATGTLGLYC